MGEAAPGSPAGGDSRGRLLVVYAFQAPVAGGGGSGGPHAPALTSSPADLRAYRFLHRGSMEIYLREKAGLFAAQADSGGGTICYDVPDIGGIPVSFVVRRFPGPEHGLGTALPGVPPVVVAVAVASGCSSGAASAGHAALDFLGASLAAAPGDLAAGGSGGLQAGLSSVQEHVLSGGWSAAAPRTLSQIDGSAIIEEAEAAEAAKWRREGYWASSFEEVSESSLPWPQPGRHPWTGEAAFCRRLRSVERLLASEGKRRSWMGTAHCRLCQCRNGWAGYEDTDYWVMWPQGFLHYVEAHHVKPSAWFVEYVDKRLAGRAGCAAHLCPLL